MHHSFMHQSCLEINSFPNALFSLLKLNNTVVGDIVGKSLSKKRQFLKPNLIYIILVDWSKKFIINHNDLGINSSTLC